MKTFSAMVACALCAAVFVGCSSPGAEKHDLGHVAEEFTAEPMPAAAEEWEAGEMTRMAPAPMPPSPPTSLYDISGDEYKKRTDAGFSTVASNPVSTFSIDVDNASYTNVRSLLSGGQMPPADAVRTEEMVNYFRYDAAEEADNGSAVRIATELVRSPWNASHSLLRLTIAGKPVDSKKAPPANLVFLVDVSGSMEGDDRLGLVRRGLLMMVRQMRPVDRVSIVTYAGHTQVVLPPTSGERRQTIEQAIHKLGAGGGTDGGSGILIAYDQAKKHFDSRGNNRIILATDGDFNLGVSDTDELVKIVERERASGIYLTVLGVGRGNLKDERMESLAQHGNGNYHYIDNIREAERVLATEATSTVLTVADDVKIQVEFNPATVQAYRLVGYENRMLKREDFTDDSVDAGDLGAGQSVTALYEIVPVGASFSGRTVDSAKYTSTTVNKRFSGELLTVHVRHKKPGAKKSVQAERVVRVGDLRSFEQAGADTRFAVAVASFAQKLRKNTDVGNLSWDAVVTWAEQAAGKSDERREFVGLVRTAKLLEQTTGSANWE